MRIIISIIIILIDLSLYSQSLVGEYENENREYFKFSKDTVELKVVLDTVFTTYLLYKGRFQISKNELKTFDNLYDDFFIVQASESVNKSCSICMLFESEEVKYRTIIFKKNKILKRLNYYTDDKGCIKLDTDTTMFTQILDLDFELIDIVSKTKFQLSVSPYFDYRIHLNSDESIDNSLGFFKFIVLQNDGQILTLKDCKTKRIINLQNNRN